MRLITGALLVFATSFSCDNFPFSTPDCKAMADEFMAGAEAIKFAEPIPQGLALIKANDEHMGKALLFLSQGAASVKAKLTEVGVVWDGTCVMPDGRKVDYGHDDHAGIQKNQPAQQGV